MLVPINNYFFDIFTLTSVTKSDSSFELDFVLKMMILMFTSCCRLQTVNIPLRYIRLAEDDSLSRSPRKGK